MGLALCYPRGLTFDGSRLEYGWWVQVYDDDGVLTSGVDSFGFFAQLTNTPAAIRTKIIDGAVAAALLVNVTVTTDKVWILGYADKGP